MGGGGGGNCLAGERKCEEYPKINEILLLFGGGGEFPPLKALKKNTVVDRASCEKSTLFLCHVDFRKAFDSVDHNCLLVQLGISQQTDNPAVNVLKSHVKITRSQTSSVVKWE